MRLLKYNGHTLFIHYYGNEDSYLKQSRSPFGLALSPILKYKSHLIEITKTINGQKYSAGATLINPNGLRKYIKNGSIIIEKMINNEIPSYSGIQIIRVGC